jgi:hypothetical protein
VADEEVLFVRGTLHPHSCSLLFRGPNTTMLDEMERAMHDALCAVARTLESGHVVAGGGEREREKKKILTFSCQVRWRLRSTFTLSRWPWAWALASSSPWQRCTLLFSCVHLIAL